MKIKCLVLLLFCFILVGCSSGKEKEVVTTSKFEEISNSNSFIYLDNIGSYPNIDYMSEAKKAISDDIVIEYIVYTDEDSAKKAQDGQIENFRNIKGTAVTEHKDDGKNYYKFWMVSNGYYMISSRVDNTLVFCKTLLNNKEKVEKIIEDMGY